MKSLENKLNELLSNIETKLKLKNKPETHSLNNDRIKELLPKLKQLLKSKSPKAKALIKELNEAGLSGNEFDLMVKELNKYDFKNALKILEDIEEILN